MIQEGKLIVFPLDSIYAVGGSAFETSILSKIVTLFDIDLPFVPILVVKSLELAQKLVFFNEDALTLANKYWPGNLTLLLPVNKQELDENPPFDMESFVFKDSETIAIQISADIILQTVLDRLDAKNLAPLLTAVPVFLENHFICNDVDHLIDSFGHESFGMVLDEGKIRKGQPPVPNTILEIKSGQIRLLQEGTISEEEIAEELGIKQLFR